ncbi:hypothetical protein [Saccharibacillus deserti]|uniref:hypothetical protein n=1 Tax=Saccharibacillus deserti TaxID=1634444 RepID=UPI001557DE16|nr:hypothetical protein [Saccharibacillus deserti]
MGMLLSLGNAMLLLMTLPWGIVGIGELIYLLRLRKKNGLNLNMEVPSTNRIRSLPKSLRMV